MSRLRFSIFAAALLALAFMFAGCLVSGTFIIVEDFEFTAETGYYNYPVDLTDESEWEDHKDDIDLIDAVGAEFYITSIETGPVEFDVYIDDFADSLYSSPAEVDSNATRVFSITVDPGKTKITYAQSLGLIENVAIMKTLVKGGKFQYYGTSTGNLGTTFQVDSAKVIVTISGGKS